MLKITLRKITALILFFFTLIFSVQHVLYMWQTDTSDLAPFVYEQYLNKIMPLLPWIDRADYDFHLRMNKQPPRHPDIAVVEINERSIQRLGQFPFSHAEYGRFIDYLAKNGAKVVGFDITFPEFERNDALAELKKVESEIAHNGGNEASLQILKNRMLHLDGDASFASVLKNTSLPVVLGFAFTSKEVEQDGALHSISAASKRLLSAHSLRTMQINEHAFATSQTENATTEVIPAFPNEKLLAALPPQSLGSFQIDPDEDSAMRKVQLAWEYGDAYFPSLSVNVVAKYLGTTVKLIKDNGLWIRDESGRINVPLDASGALPVRFYGKAHEFPFYEFIDVLDGKHDKDLKGKIILLGVTAVGLKDIRATPFTKDFPGTEVLATVASNILNHSYLEKDQRFYFAGYFFLLAIGCFVSLLVSRLHPMMAFLLTIVTVVATQFSAQYFFFDRGIVVPTFMPSIEFCSLLFAGILYRYFTQEKEKKFVRAAFSRYVSGAVVTEILKDQTKLRLGGQKKELSVLFCDMKGFTKFSEGMDAEFLTQVLNQFFTRMTEIVLRNRGTLDKYIGDALMCFWGAPLDLSNHAELTCRAALEMMTELTAINQEWQQKYGFTVGVRIGINSGEMFVGNMGSDQVFSYTVMGDNVNLGSRVEGVNNFYGTSVIICAGTANRVRDSFWLRALDRVQVKGKEEAVDIFELIALKEKGVIQPEWIHAFEHGRDLYLAGNWVEAEAAFGTCLALKPDDKPSQVFLERIVDLKKSSSKEWNGVWKLESK